MTQEERRAEILNLLSAAHRPLTGSALSKQLGVTRQVIVGDVAVLRARGEEIIATPQGYILYGPKQEAGFRGKVAVRHGGGEDLARELYLIVGLGATVVDVTVEHPLYGELTASLQLSTSEDVDRFLHKMEEVQAEPLLSLTDGYHLHTLEAPSSEILDAVRDALRTAGFLAE